jgi:DNA-binding transcriptional MerR regulator
VKAQRTYRVKDVARMTGVSIRTLHHYDEIGLLVPRARNSAGYRLYGDEDLLRLQQILIGRELGLSLEEIRRSLDDPRFDRKKALLTQKEQLRARVRQTEAMIRAVDVALAIVEKKAKGGTMDMKEIFDGFDPSEYEDEARERWGKTDAYKESMKRTKRYTADDWKRIKLEQQAIYQDAAAMMKAGGKPSDPKAMDIAERHRLSIDRWFYPCTHAMQLGLASLYESDSRFAENINKHGDGLTDFLVAAIRANAKRNEG